MFGGQIRALRHLSAVKGSPERERQITRPKGSKLHKLATDLGENPVLGIDLVFVVVDW